MKLSRNLSLRNWVFCCLSPLLTLVLAPEFQLSLCQAQQAGTLPAVASPGIPAVLFISGGDLLDVEVFDTPELSGKFRVTSDGYLDLPVAGRIFIAKMNPIQAGTAIADLLKTKQIMIDPRVTTFVTEYPTAGVSVLGEVNKPGNYLLLGQHSLYDALSQAGGFTQREGSTIVITHRSDPGAPISIPVYSPNYSQLQATTTLEPGDVVVVSRADSIFVVGDVQHAGEFSIVAGAPLNALNALALAAGANRTAKIEKASIVRETAGVIQTIPIDLKKVSENREPDVILQARDVLVVPRSGLRTFLDYALPNATGALVGTVGAALVYR